ncbi:MAG: hypothetical protein KAT79_06195 [candidate division Zixibacteria bacterium]|nr:hypothetical protein [candidate division Zixibacteria bacterium]
MSGATGAVVVAAIANAIKASGAIVKMEPQEFVKITNKSERPVVVAARGGWLNKSHKYLTAYGGLIFYTSSSTQLQLSSRVEWVSARTIWIPN